MHDDPNVLIVGGSLVGLSAACFLAKQGVRVDVFERHSETPVQYKFRGISPRSMEIYRSFGLEAEIRAASDTVETEAIARVRNLRDPDVKWNGPGWFDPAGISATPFATRDQDELEPILRRHAEAAGARVHFNTEVVDLAIVDDRPVIWIEPVGGGERRKIEGRYLIAADGVAGSIRERLGIGQNGPGVLQHWANIIFESDLPLELGGRRFTSAFVTDINGSLVQRKEGGHWLLALQYAPEHGASLDDFDEVRCRALVEQAAGHQDFAFRLVDVRGWNAAGFLADRFRAGPAFIMGDAAHSMPPTGGFGGNTGIHDAHNLAWKLAMVIDGRAAPTLLDSYEPERRAIAEATLAQAPARLATWFKDLGDKLPPPVAIVPDEQVVLGQVYNRGALVPERAADCPPFEDPHEPTGRPGTRAPHLTLAINGREVPVHDLFGHGFKLLTDDADIWRDQAQQIAPAIEVIGIGEGQEYADPSGRFLVSYGLAAGGASLVRPDGVVAWRTGSIAKTSLDLQQAWNSLRLRR